MFIQTQLYLLDTSANEILQSTKTCCSFWTLNLKFIKSFQKTYLKNGTTVMYIEFLMNQIDYKIQPKLIHAEFFSFLSSEIFSKFGEIKPKQLYCSFKVLFLMPNGLFFNLIVVWVK